MPDEVFTPPSKLLPVLGKYFHIRPAEKGAAPPGLEVNLADLSSIPLRLRIAVPLVYSPRLAKYRIDAVAFDEVFADTLRFKGPGAGRASHQVLLLAVGGDVAEIRNAKREELSQESVALLGKDDLDRLVQAGSKSREEMVEALAAVLRRDLSLKALHPYQPRHPAVAGAFFGRANTLRDLTVGEQSASALVVGNRRMGKTSLLLELRRRLEKDGVQTTLLSGLNRHTPELVAHQIAEELLSLPPKAAAELKMAEIPERIHKLSKQSEQRFAIFFDEVDKLIEHDAPDGWPVLRTLKVIKDQYSESCRIFLAGFRYVMAKYNDDQDTNNPLANFGGSVPVSRFERPERKDMIERPLRLLGLDLPPELYNLVDKVTVGMPELIQICCKGLVLWFQDNKALPSVDDFNEWIFNNDEYKGAVRYTFFRNTNPFERLVTFLLIRDSRSRKLALENYSFDVRQVRALLQARDPRVRPAVQLEDTMRALSTASIIEKVERRNNYRFSLPSLEKYFFGKDQIEAAIAQALAETKAHLENEAWLKPAGDDLPAGLDG